MRLSDFHRTTSFRLALMLLLLFGVGPVMLFGFLYNQASGYLVSRTDEWLFREQSAFASLTPQDAMQRLASRPVTDLNLERPFVLFDPSGRRIAGSNFDVPTTFLRSVRDDQAFDLTIQLNGHGERYRALTHVLPSGNRLLIAQDVMAERRFDQMLIRSFVSGGLASAALGLLGAVVAGINAVASINGVTRATRRIVAGDLSQRLPTRGRSADLDRLAEVINGMLDEIERLMHEVKGVCDNIAHDLRTPLTRLLAGLERARRRARSADDYATAVEEAIVEIRGILRTFGALLRISEVENGARRSGFTTVDLATVTADVAEYYEPIAEEKAITLRLKAEGNGYMHGDSSLLFEAISNLLDNALKYTPAGGRVTLRTFAANGQRGVEVADTGPGIPPTEREAVLRRFHRVEESRHTPGTGLGLALVTAVARLHGMDLTITDAAPGCRITLAGQGRTEASVVMAPHESQPSG